MALQSLRPSYSNSPGGAGEWAVPIQGQNSQQIPTRSESIQRNNGSAELQASWRSLFAFTTRAHTPSILFSGAASVLAGVLKPTASIFFGKIFSILANFGRGGLDLKDTLHGIAI